RWRSAASVGEPRRTPTLGGAAPLRPLRSTLSGGRVPDRHAVVKSVHLFVHARIWTRPERTVPRRVSWPDGETAMTVGARVAFLAAIRSAPVGARLSSPVRRRFLPGAAADAGRTLG